MCMRIVFARRSQFGDFRDVGNGWTLPELQPLLRFEPIASKQEALEFLDLELELRHVEVARVKDDAPMGEWLMDVATHDGFEVLHACKGAPAKDWNLAVAIKRSVEEAEQLQDCVGPSKPKRSRQPL